MRYARQVGASVARVGLTDWCCAVPFPATALFDVVADVNQVRFALAVASSDACCVQYRHFLPFCVDSRVTKVLSPTEVEADLVIGFRVFTGALGPVLLHVVTLPMCAERYSSRVTLNRPNSIRVQASAAVRLRCLNRPPDPFVCLLTSGHQLVAVLAPRQHVDV